MVFVIVKPRRPGLDIRSPLPSGAGQESDGSLRAFDVFYESKTFESKTQDVVRVMENVRIKNVAGGIKLAKHR